MLNMSTSPENTVFLPSNEVMDRALDYLNILVAVDSVSLLKVSPSPVPRKHWIDRGLCLLGVCFENGAGVLWL